jgi:hypothetical protein
MVAATNAWMLAFDNLSHLPEWLSDALCRLATGGGFGTRALFTNQEEALFDAQRPVLLTGIDKVVTRGDLLDRSLLVSLPEIRDEQRRPEDEFWQAFEAVRPGILGALLDALSAVLRRLAPNLRALGVTMTFARDSDKLRTRRIDIRGEQSAHSVPERR